MEDSIGKFRILIRLALIDGRLDESEINFLFRIARIEGISEEVIQELIEEEGSDAEDRPPLELTYDEKIAVLSDVIRIMKADGMVLDAEVKFSESIARSFGFTEKAIGFLSGNINMDANNSTAISKIRYRMKKYLIDKDAETKQNS